MAAHSRLNGSVRVRPDGSLLCAHCESDLPGVASTYLSLVPVHVGPPSEGGPRINADPRVWVDAEVVFRQYYCPSCWMALQTEVAPAHAAGTP
jgi:N-methylhydantoinase B